MNTPIIPTSRIRNEIMYSLIRSLIGLNEARMLIHESVVVRTTRSERQAVDADLVLDAEQGDPVERLHELELAARVRGRSR